VTPWPLTLERAGDRVATTGTFVFEAADGGADARLSGLKRAGRAATDITAGCSRFAAATLEMCEAVTDPCCNGIVGRFGAAASTALEGWATNGLARASTNAVARILCQALDCVTFPSRRDRDPTVRSSRGGQHTRPRTRDRQRTFRSPAMRCRWSPFL